MNAKRLPSGNILIPMRATDDSGKIGDGMVEIGPEHPQFAKWDEWLRRQEQAQNGP